MRVTTADGRVELLDDSLSIGAPAGFNPNGATVPIYGVGGDTVVLPYNPAHIMANEDAITNGDPQVALEGLRFALESVAKGVARMVRKDVRPSDPVMAPAEAPASAAQ